MKTVSRFALSSAVLLALSACGNKGPLVLPEKPVPVQPAASPAVDDPAATPTQVAPVGEQGATPPVQIKSEDQTSAPSAADAAAEQAVDEGGTSGNE